MGKNSSSQTSEMGEEFVADAGGKTDPVAAGGPGWVVTTGFSPLQTEARDDVVKVADVKTGEIVTGGGAQGDVYQVWVNGREIDLSCAGLKANPPFVAVTTEADRLRKLIDDKLAADEEDKKAEAEFVEARKRLDDAMRKAKACHQELAKALGFSIKETAGKSVPGGDRGKKKKRKDRPPLMPYKSTLSGRERMIVLLGIKSATRKGLEDIARQMGCGTVSSGLTSDDTFEKGAGDLWTLTGKGRAEFGKLIGAEDGKKFWADAKRLIGDARGLNPEPAKTVAVDDKFAELKTGDMAVILLGQGGMRQAVFQRVLESASGRRAAAILYSGSRTLFAKTGDLWGLSEYGKARLKVLMATPDGQAFRKMAQDALGQTK